MARIISKGNPAIFTTIADITDGTTENITYQWQVDGVDLLDGTSVPTKSDISSFFFSPDVEALGQGLISTNTGGYVGTKNAFAESRSNEGGGFENAVRYSVPLVTQKYFSEFVVTDNNWISGIGWFGVLDLEHWTAGSQLWQGTIGTRMSPWIGQTGGYGERTGTIFQLAPNKNLNDFVCQVNDIIGVTVNPDAGTINLYKNGDYFATLRNSRGIGKNLHIFLQSSTSNRSLPSLSCTARTTASSYASNYYFASKSVNQDASIGAGGGVVEVSGAQSSTLTVISGNVSTFNLKCKISHPTAYNSPILTNAIELDVVDPSDKNFLNFEYHPIRNGTTARLETVDLQSGVEYIIDRSTQYQNITFYSPDKDMDVELEMFAPKGSNSPVGGRNGGNGGYSLIRFTVERNKEYSIAGHFIGQFFVYKQASLLAVVGSGGDAGQYGEGGRGGGVSNPGSNGTGFGAGVGGEYIPPDQLGQNGISGSSTNQPQDIAPRATAPDGGRTVRCPIGNYWAQQGFSPCQNMGKVRYRHADGTEVTNSTNTIERGWKPGTGGYRANRGAGGVTLYSTDPAADGGFGATGGAGGNRAGGAGGGSGYHSSDVTVITSTAGGSTRDTARLVFRSFVPPITNGTFSHSFSNSTDTTTNLSFSGSISNISVESPGAPDAWSTAGGNLNAKHYLVTMNQSCTSINVIDVSNRTAGGGPPAGDSGMAVETIQKINSSQFRVWFRRGNGFNTYVRSATIIAVP